MTFKDPFAESQAELRAFINAPASISSDQTFHHQALRLFGLQFEAIPVYRRFCEQRLRTPSSIGDWRHIPALPISAFKEFPVTSLHPEQRSAFFESSGTTAQKRSRHFHDAASLESYAESLCAAFRAAASPLDVSWRYISLTPRSAAVPHSSLAHMIDRIHLTFSRGRAEFFGQLDGAQAWTVDIPALVACLDQCAMTREPVFLFGTAFNYVALLDHLKQSQRRIALPRDSRLFDTGGYKGRSRVLERSELHVLLSQHLNVTPPQIISEYGMCELSSQAYARADDEWTFRFPPWARARVVSPETGSEVDLDECGLLRIYDLANLRSVLAIETEDIARRRPQGFQLLGRAQDVEPRGCSLLSADGSWPGKEAPCQ